MTAKSKPTHQAGQPEINLSKNKQAKGSFSKSRALFQDTLDSLLEGCQILDFDWRYLYLNAVAEIHNRRPNQELLGNIYMEMWPGIEATQMFAEIKRCLEERVSTRLENRFVYPDGKVGWFRLSVQPIEDGVVIFSEDITEHQQVEQEIRWLASFPELNPNPIVEIDSAGTVSYMNPAARHMFPDLPIQGFKHLWLSGLENVMDRFQQEGISELQREIQIGADWYSQPLYYVPEIARLRVYGTEITKRKQAEQQTLQMKRLYAVLSQVNQAIVRVKSRDELFQSICVVAVQFGEFDLAWVGLLDEVTGDVRPVAAHGLDVKQWPFPLVNVKADPVVNGLIASAIRTSRVVTSDDLQSDDTMQSVHELFEKHAYHASAGVPLQLRGKTIGILNLISSQVGFFQAAEEIHLLEEMGLDISFALDNLEREREQRLADAELQRTSRWLLASQRISATGGWAIDLKTGMVWASPEARRIYGMDDRELTLSYIQSFPLPQDRPSLDAALQELIHHSVPYDIEFQITRGTDGMIADVHSLAEYDPEEHLILGVIQDITERRQAEETLRDSEERLRLSLQASNQGLYDLNIQTGKTVVNRQYAEMLGYDFETFVETNAAWIERLHPDDREKVAKVYSDYVRGLLPEYRVEFRQRMKDGNWKWILSLGKVIEYDPEGQPLRMLGTHTDITERKQAEQALQESEERFSKAFYESPIGILLVDMTDGTIRDVNDALLEMAALKREELVGQSATQLNLKIDPEVSAAITQELMEHGTFRNREVQWQLRDGQRRYVLNSGALVTIGGRIHNLALIQDITERKHTEEVLRDSEERFRMLFENNPATMMLIEPVSGAIKDANRAAAEFYGYSLAELRSMDINEINQLTPDEIYAERMLALNEERNFFVFQHRLANGEIHPVEVHSAPMKVDGKTLLFSIVYDISERKRVEEEIQLRSHQLLALLDTSQSLTESLNLPEVLQKITDKSVHVLKVETTAIYLVEGEQLYLGACTPPLPANFPDELRRAILSEHPHIAEALDTGQPVILPNTAASASLTASERTVTAALGLQTIVYVPLAAKNNVMGVLILGTIGQPREFSRNEEEVARTLSNQAALAIANAKLYEDLSIYVKELESQIAERKRAETDLREIQNRMSGIVESAMDAIISIDINQQIVLANSAAEQMFGYDQGELIGKPLDLLLPEQFRNSHAHHVRQFGETGITTRSMNALGAIYGLRASGEEFPAEASISQISIGTDKMYTVILRDITERKQSEAQIQRQLKHLNGLRMIDIAISSSFDMSLTLDVVLQEAHSQLEVDACAILILNTQLQTIDYAASRGFYSNALHHTQLKLREGYAGQAVLKRTTIHISDIMEMGGKLSTALPLERESFVDYYGTPLIVKGEVIGVLEIYHRSHLKVDSDWLEFLETLAGQAAIAIDNAQMFESLQRSNANLERRVTERTAELNRANVELERANRTKDEFLANMSHELRTPLTSILGLSESLLEQQRDPLTGYQERSIQVIESSGRHLLELINDILDLSKIEAGKFDFYPQPILVDEICRSSLSFIKAQATKKSITVSYTNEASVSRIYADPRRLKQILVNLLSNAVKFTRQRGNVTLLVTSELTQDLIRFSVIDDGIGISGQDLKRLFQPFVQVDSSLNRQHDGTGLGLALVQRLTDLHGGSVQVESEVGKGSCFTVNLACKTDEIAKLEAIKSQPASAVRKEAGISETASKSSEPRKVVLLAEDNMANVLTMGEYLKSHDYEVVVAHDGLEAIKLAETNHPDVILMDIQMPVMNGLDAIARLRDDSRFAFTPIVALTALAMSGDRERCLAAGANEYMSKPVSLKLLVETIHNLLERQNP